MDDEGLDRMLRAANPARTPRDASPDHDLMLRIMSSPRSRRHRMSRLTLLVAPVAALLVAVLAIVVTNPFEHSAAAAYGPPPMEWAPTQQTLSDVAATAEDRLSRSSGPTRALRESVATSWSLSVNESGEPDQVTSISPLVTELVWNEDLSGRRVVTAGLAYPVEGGTVPTDALEEGTVIDDMEFALGEFPAVVPDAGALDAVGFRDLLGAYAPTEQGSTAGDAMLGIADILGEWTLTNEQQGYLLDALLRFKGLTVLGTTTDRLGREVVGLQSEAVFRPGETTTILISADTGRIVGMETAVVGEDASAPVPVGTVIHYALWKDSE